ncbi:MAG: hypothetical protein PHI16_05245 [Methanocellales archaeon]|nr:hypothetical protein [Methanocellales archaeon]
MAAGYSNDADPESEGVAIDVIYQDSKSEPIDFTNFPMNVVIELYGYHDISDTFDHTKMELVHNEFITMDPPMRLGEMLGKYIKIPFDGISSRSQGVLRIWGDPSNSRDVGGKESFQMKLI